MRDTVKTAPILEVLAELAARTRNRRKHPDTVCKAVAMASRAELVAELRERLTVEDVDA